MTHPLVSCVMPTANRRAFVPTAIDHFLRQDWPDRELVILDDGEDAVADLIPDDPRVRYLRTPPRRTVGAKRNALCESARGDILLHWDDDDWHAADRITRQVRALLDHGAAVCGVRRLLFLEPAQHRAWEYVYPETERFWLGGSTLCYTRDYWRAHPFEAIDRGEDARFVWAGDPRSMHAMADATFHVGIIHGRNVSPKRPRGAWWRPYPLEAIRTLMGEDFARHAEVASPVPAPSAAPRRPAPPAAPPLRNVHACLVHEQPECVIDLVRNLRRLDPESEILLYDGSAGGTLLDAGFPWAQLGAMVHPSPRPMKWGRLHDFALDCLRFLHARGGFDAMTIVDSDQLAIRSGYARHLAERVAERDRLGVLGNAPARQGRDTRIPPAATAQAEAALWRPFLRRFEGGEDKFVHWTFWPSTVIGAEAGRALVELFDRDAQLAGILAQSRLWATEEVLVPTLAALLGFRVEPNPCSYDFVKYKVRYGARELAAALARPDAFWMHPVPRRYDDPIRTRLREQFDHYRNATPAALPDAPLALAPILRAMRAVEGWLEDDEAELLAVAAREALAALAAPHAVVEIGSHCGRATVVLGLIARAAGTETRVYAIDAFDGNVGALDRPLHRAGPTLAKFRRNIEQAGLTQHVEPIVGRAPGVRWDRPVSVLLVDGLHDYASVAQDFHAFAPWLREGGVVLFHDYAPYFPGVQAFVDELAAASGLEPLGRAGTMVAFRKCAASAAAAPARLAA